MRYRGKRRVSATGENRRCKVLSKDRQKREQIRLLRSVNGLGRFFSPQLPPFSHCAAIFRVKFTISHFPGFAILLYSKLQKPGLLPLLLQAIAPIHLSCNSICCHHGMWRHGATCHGGTRCYGGLDHVRRCISVLMPGLDIPDALIPPATTGYEDL